MLRILPPTGTLKNSKQYKSCNWNLNKNLNTHLKNLEAWAAPKVQLQVTPTADNFSIKQECTGISGRLFR